VSRELTLDQIAAVAAKLEQDMNARPRWVAVSNEVPVGTVGLCISRSDYDALLLQVNWVEKNPATFLRGANFGTMMGMNIFLLTPGKYGLPAATPKEPHE